MMALFLGRAVVDEALPPSFLTSVLPALEGGSLGVAVVQSAGGAANCFVLHHIWRAWPCILSAAVPCCSERTPCPPLGPAGAILGSRHAAERLQNCWHGGALTLDEIKAAVKAALDEYLVHSRAPGW